METPNIVILDVDGVLTDGCLTIDHKGEKLFKKFTTKDVRAIRELVANGFEVYIVTADDWPGTKHFAEKVGAEFICLKDKMQIRQTIGDRPFIAVGDDAWDVGILKAATIAFCPLDADWSVKQVKGIRILKTRGGKGVVAEVIRLLDCPPPLITDDEYKRLMKSLYP